MKDVIVEIENLSHKYAIDWAVKDLNFTIERNSIYGLLGSNGAGKSTLMNIMCGVLRQTEGSVRINGIDIRKDPVNAKRYIGFLPQKPPLLTDLTIEEYLGHTARMRQVPNREVRKAVDEALERCSIAHFRKRLIKNLSGGYQQRVGIAQAIIHKPELVVLDEPTNGLDPNQIVDVRKLIKEIATERTVLISTHILTEVQVICQYIKMIEHGTEVFSGSVDEFDSYILPDSVLISLEKIPDPDVIIQAIPEITKVEKLKGSEYRFYLAADKKLLEKIVEVSISNGWRLTQLQTEKVSLDRIFAQLSKNN